MNFARRRFFRDGFVLAGSAVMAPVLLGQDRSRDSVHPPEPSGHELDMLLLRDRDASSPGPALNGHQRDVEFRSCLEQLQLSVAKVRDEISSSPLSQILPVQVYRETQAMERLVKRMKRLAKS